MEEEKPIPVGSLIRDMGRLGVITKIIKSGALETEQSLLRWRINYEIIYLDDGTITVIGEEALKRLVLAEIIELV